MINTVSVTELRLNNLLENMIGDVVEITSINNNLLEYRRRFSDQEGFVYDDDGEEFEDSASGFDPIPLTEEWLLRLGFMVHYNANGEAVASDIVIDSQRTIAVFDLDTESPNAYMTLSNQHGITDYIFIGRNIGGKFYVHQLQNLYHALTGKELEVKK